MSYFLLLTTTDSIKDGRSDITLCSVLCWSFENSIFFVTILVFWNQMWWWEAELTLLLLLFYTPWLEMTAWADKHSSKEVLAEGYFPVAFYRIRSIFATTTSSLVAFKKNVGLRHFYISFTHATMLILFLRNGSRAHLSGWLFSLLPAHSGESHVIPRSNRICNHFRMFWVCSGFSSQLVMPKTHPCGSV